VSTPRLPTPIRKGQRLGNKLPVDLINAGRDALKDRQRDTPMMAKARRPAIGGSGSGGGLTPCVVYGNAAGKLAAGSYDSSGSFTPGDDARCLPVTTTDGVESPDLTADFILAKWRSAAELDLASSDCCGSEPSVAPTGVLIDEGLGAAGNDRVYDDDDLSGALVVTGRGVAEEAVITVTITDGTNTLTPTVTNNEDGTWTAASADLTADPFIKGVVKITATDGATDDVRIIVYSGDDSPTEIGHFTGRPPRPDMTAATDLGASDTDNRTSDTTPTFACAHGGVSPVDAGGPIPRLYIKGVLVASGTLTSYSTTIPVVSSVDLTPGSALDAGYQNAQLVLEWTDTSEDFFSPPSLQLRINIDEDATEETEPAKRWCRLGWINEVNGVKWVDVDKCPREVTEDEITKLDA
jgi:hypothetical protein